MTYRLEIPISPKDSSSCPDETRDHGGDVVDIVKANTAMEMSDQSNLRECLPVEEGEQAIRLRTLPSPTPPSRQEMLEHNLTHWPFRSWCKHCVAGKAKANRHSPSGGLAESEVPVVSFDYMFMGDKSNESEEDDHANSDEVYDRDNLDEDKANILVARDSKSRTCAAIPVPKKGLDSEDWSLKECLRYLEFVGYTSVLIKSDQERALGALMRKVRTHRGDQTQTMHEHSPVGDSKSNGLVERSVQTIQGQIRTMRSALEGRIGAKVNPVSPAFAWMCIHAANIINMCEIGKDGRVPYQRLRGRKMHTDLVEFGECICYQPLKHLELGKAEARWSSGIYLGFKINSGEKIVATESGIIKVRSIRRKLEAERWNIDEHKWIKRYPWKPYEDSDEDEVHIRPPQPATPVAHQDHASLKGTW